jgi:SEC-C motif
MTTDHEEQPAEAPAPVDETRVDHAPKEPPASDAVALVAQMVAAGEWPTPELLQQILDQGEAAVDPLIDVLETRQHGWPEEASLCHAADLLSILRAPRAIPALREAVRFYKNDTTEALATSLATFGQAGFDALLDLIQDPAVSGYQCYDIIHGAMQAAGADPVLRARLAEVLRNLFADFVKDAQAVSRFQDELLSDAEPAKDQAGDDVDFHGAPIEELDDDEFKRMVAADRPPGATPRETVAASSKRQQFVFDPDELDNLLTANESLGFLAIDLGSLADPLARDMIREAFDKGLIPHDITDLEETEEQYKSGGTVFSPTLPSLDEYRERYNQKQEDDEALARMPRVDFPTRASYPSWEASPSQPHLPRAEPVEPFRNAAPKIGRNDPCWCGSGKKYKKCHLGKDAPS